MNKIYGAKRFTDFKPMERREESPPYELFPPIISLAISFIELIGFVLLMYFLYKLD